MAKNRLQQFYNPKLATTTLPPEVSEEERIATNFGVEEKKPTALLQVDSSKAPAPESFGPYKKKGEESNGVLAMIDMLIADLSKEMTEAQVEEKNSQAEYETFMADATKKRAQDSKALTDKQSAKAEMEDMIESAKDSKASLEKELKATNEYMGSLHGQCDWLLKNFDLRKSARAEEIDSLGNAKAVLSGADYSFLQKTRRVNLRTRK
mmetsp:Transcript_24056/g.44171  ORF Transcript_24056/g.44171 Transcript_24056/m.44171 type:complete len:208 (+) Transcript_24056:1-624(+)